MAVCNLNQDILRSAVCGYALKSVVEVYLANFADVTSVSVGAATEGTAGQQVTAITMASDAQWFKIEPNKDSASFSDALQEADGGAKYRLHTLSFNVGGQYTPEMVDALDALSLGKYIGVARLSDGSYVMLGRLTGLEAQADGGNLSGAATATEFSGISVTLVANTTEAVLPLNEASIAVVTGAA